MHGPGSSVGIATGYGLDGPGTESQRGRDFPHLFRPALGTTQPHVQWVPGLSRGKERPGRDTDPSPLLVPWSRKSRAIPLLPLWAIGPVESLSACTRVHFFYLRFRSQWPPAGGVGLRLLACWDCEFRIQPGTWMSVLLSVVWCQVDVSVTDRSLVQKSPTESGVSEYDKVQQYSLHIHWVGRSSRLIEKERKIFKAILTLFYEKIIKKNYASWKTESCKEHIRQHEIIDLSVLLGFRVVNTCLYNSHFVCLCLCFLAAPAQSSEAVPWLLRNEGRLGTPDINFIKNSSSNEKEGKLRSMAGGC